MVMASSETRERIEESITLPVKPPLLSIIVPVYNDSNKIESTLRKLKAQVDKLDSTIAKLEEKESKRREENINTGRKIIENAGSAILLDQYFSRHSTDTAIRQIYENDNGFQSLSLGSPWYEIIVVNDGSKDDTRNVIKRISSADKTIHFISYSTNMGKGYAIKQGVLHSLGKYVMFLDGDGDISTDILSRYLEGIARSDIVIGSKYHRLSVVNAPPSRKFFSKCFHLLVKVMLGIKVSDTQVGLKAGKGEVLRKIFGRVTVKRYAFDAEMLAVAGVLRLKVVELPVKIDLDKSFKKKEIMKMALDVLRVAYRLRVMRWYQKTMERKRPSLGRFALV